MSKHMMRLLAMLVCMAMVVTMVPVKIAAEEMQTIPAETVVETTAAVTTEETVTETTTAEATEETVVETTVEETEATVPVETMPTIEDPPQQEETEAIEETTAATEIAEEVITDDDVQVTVTASGTCGENVSWILDNTGLLTIYGNGAMDDYQDMGTDQPWYNYRSKVKSIVVDNGVTTIGSHAFYRFSNLTNISISNSVTWIRSYAFSFCTGLTNITIPDSVASIEGYTFDCAYSLESIILPPGISEIEKYTFSYCFDLRSVTIPESVTQIGVGAFISCTALTDVYYTGREADWSALVLNIASKNDPLLNAPNKHFTEDSGFVVEKDGWSFSNHQNNFGDVSEGYFITQSDYDRLVNNLPDNERSLITKREDNEAGVSFKSYNIVDENLFDYQGQDLEWIEWGGSCYGMSAWTCLVKNGVLKASDIEETAESLFELTLTEKVESAINFYHFQQKFSGRINAETTWYASQSQMGQLQSLEQLGKAANDSGKVFIICYQWYREFDEYGLADIESAAGHAVVGYGWEEIDPVEIEINGYTHTYDKRILIYDCSDPYAEKDDHLYYNDEGICCIPGWNFLSTDRYGSDWAYNNGQLLFATDDEQFLDIVNYVTGEVNLDVDLTSVSTFSDEEYTMEYGGQSYNIAGFSVTGGDRENAPMVMLMSNITANRSTTRGTAMAILPKGIQECTVTSEEAMSFQLETPGTLSSVHSTASGQIRFWENGTVDITLEAPAEYSITMVSDQTKSGLPWSEVTVMGNGATEISTELHENGILLSSDCLEKVTVCLRNGEECQSEQVSSDIDVLITEKEGELAFLADRDGDSIYEEEISKCEKPTDVETTPMYRLYNPNSGEHFYTGSVEERENLVGHGWQYEGIAWNAPTKTGDHVHRLFNPNNGDHHYTMSLEERDMLVGVGWKYEGVAWNSASAENIPQYRLYNPNADCGSHHYTGSEEERDYLVSLGWHYEGIGWFGMLN